jgi:hypothetical protein
VQDGASHSGVAEGTSLGILCRVDWFWFDCLTQQMKLFLQNIGNYQSAWCDILQDLELSFILVLNFL